VAIRVHIACDDKTYRDTIASLLDADPQISIVDKSREAEAGVAAVQDVTPDVVVLAVPPQEDVIEHTRAYQSAAPDGGAVVAFCILDRQERDYRQAGVDAVVRPSDTADTLRRKVIEAHRRR
jgi:DNA-binding NarL/FixJ family response regulator